MLPVGIRLESFPFEGMQHDRQLCNESTVQESAESLKQTLPLIYIRSHDATLR